MSLSLAEKFILLAHHPEKARIEVNHNQHRFGLAGTLLMELAVKGILAVKNGRVVISGIIEKIDSELLAEVFETVASSATTHTIRHWLKRLSFRYYRYRRIVCESLERRRIMKIETRKLLGFIPLRLFYVIDIRERSALIHNLRERLLSGGRLDEDMKALAAMADACGMPGKIASDSEEKDILRTRIWRLLEESPTFTDTEKAISEIQSATSWAIMTANAARASAGA